MRPRPVSAFALVRGEPVSEIPSGLYIPPDSLKIFLSEFEGPLDLLLYLIKRQSIDIIDIPVAKVTGQYMHYISLMRELQLDLAAEYLLMSAMLTEIKSRMLLPGVAEDDSDEDDPRAELVERLREYERYKQAAEDIDNLPRCEREIFAVSAYFPHRGTRKPPPVTIDELLKAIAHISVNADPAGPYKIVREALSVRERMTIVLDQIVHDRFTDFRQLYTVAEGRSGVVIALLAILELLRNSLIEVAQNKDNGVIYIRAMS